MFPVDSDLNTILIISNITDLKLTPSVRSGFNSLTYLCVMDRYTDVLEMAKRLTSRAVTTQVNLGKVKIKGIQDLVL